MNASDWSENDVSVLRATGLPILGMQMPGYYLFGSSGFGLKTGYPYGATSYISKIWPEAAHHDVFSTPSPMDTDDSIVVSNNNALTSKPLYWDEDFDGVDAIQLAADASDMDYAAISLAEDRYLYWSMGGDPDDYTEAGATLFITCLEYLLNVD